MERINRIITNKLYLEYIDKIKKHEQNRKFCKHDVIHFLDVCRLAEIEWLNCCMELKNQSKIEWDNALQAEKKRELIYAAGLLHDIGRWQEYEKGIPHEIASGQLSLEILIAAGFEEEERTEVIEAIVNHRNSKIKNQKSLTGFLYRADKKSRPCFLCVAEKECNWATEKKNLKIL